ncbi:hypothetical protein BJ508DRAFT_415656 [Ascobolus immersus RN42]|uniref:Uncharacterized protein n=1 Tax=Ascobolus immersus RN42 TaxID=1160509 RepID=A0A3N4I583_ASCIM|nr:hypothetical protein BJ508DRAFT_415656 [Ascobolus immersus RN42]
MHDINSRLLLFSVALIRLSIASADGSNASNAQPSSLPNSAATTPSMSSNSPDPQTPTQDNNLPAGCFGWGQEGKEPHLLTDHFYHDSLLRLPPTSAKLYKEWSDDTEAQRRVASGQELVIVASDEVKSEGEQDVFFFCNLDGKEKRAPKISEYVVVDKAIEEHCGSRRPGWMAIASSDAGVKQGYTVVYGRAWTPLKMVIPADGILSCEYFRKHIKNIA